MKRNLLSLLMLIVCSTQMMAYGNTTDVLWYDKPAKIWLEALPLGNSRMGAMIYGGIDSEEIQLNDETFWSGGPHNNNSATALKYLPQVRELILNGKEKEAEDIINREFVKGPHGMKYLTLGSLKMKFDGINPSSATNYRRELDLTTATNRQTFEYDGVTYTREAFASYKDRVIIMRLKASKRGMLNFSMSHDCPLTSVSSAKGNILMATIDGVDHEGIAAKLKAQLRADVETDGEISNRGSKEIVVSNATEATIYITSATNFVNFNDVTGDASAKTNTNINSAKKLTYKALKLHQQEVYKPLYDRAKINLGGKNDKFACLPTDKRLEAFNASHDLGMVELLFNYGRYLLISSSLGKDGQPANLQGVWNNKVNAPWDSKYTININTEMNYWPAEVCNITETAEPLFAMLKDLSKTGAETAKNMYGCRGWMAHHNTDLWRICGPVDGARWGIFPNGGSWLSTHLWSHYLYTLDKDFLREYYPVMHGAAQFYLDFMVEKNGELLVVPSASPEHGGKGKNSWITAGCTMDNQIVRDVLSQALLSARILGIDESFQDSLSNAIAKLPKMKIGQYGQLQEWREDLDDPKDEHRHISHLYGLYPSNQVNPYDTPDLHRAAGVTLKQRGDEATGWSLGWKTNFWARMHDGNHAFRIICNMLRLVPSEEETGKYPDGRTFPNMFDAHPPFQIDGNFGVTAGIAEMLMQSETNKDMLPTVTLLPALPDEWRNGKIEGLKAHGNYTVNVCWEKGEMKNAEIRFAKNSPKVMHLRCRSQIKKLTPVKTYPELGIYEYEIKKPAMGKKKVIKPIIK